MWVSQNLCNATASFFPNTSSLHCNADVPGWYSISVVEDGWGFLAKPGVARIMARTGEVRVFGWHSLGDPLFSQTIEVDLDGGGSLPAEILLNTKMWEPTASLISLQVGNRYRLKAVIPNNVSIYM